MLHYECGCPAYGFTRSYRCKAYYRREVDHKLAQLEPLRERVRAQDDDLRELRAQQARNRNSDRKKCKSNIISVVLVSTKD